MPESDGHRRRRVLAITTDPAEAPFRLRIAILADLLRDDGYDFDFVPRPATWLGRTRLVATAGRYDAVIVQRKLLDPSQAQLLRRLAPRVFFDLDDAVMVQRRAIGRVSAWRKRQRFLATARAADHVVAGNRHLAEQFAEVGRPVTILPTVVDPNHYIVKRHEATERPTLVWIGSRSTLPYLRQWMPAIEAAAGRVPGLRLLTIANESVSSDVLPVDHVPWSVEAEAAALARGDIGLAPTPVDPWALGKCGFKIVQYMATGLPAVASPVGLNAEIVSAGRTGLLPDTIEQWADAIVRLASDADLRSRMGAAGRADVVSDYSLERARAVWLGLLSATS